MKKLRCAIYTRKSSEEGLEQDFNSLDAQREACSAYVMSQASEGWNLLAEPYDDGGLSGGTLERPALQRLLADVKLGRIDIIVVYKVDRLTRSLLDFAKLVETFDEAGTSFVSVTQSFNTTTSMGRLTLNMLLSFAQFEREVTAERIRDKIAASKAKGMWMGGTPPLGYRPDGRSLGIVEEHAALIRDIYARYLRLGNVRLVAEQLAFEGIKTPRRVNGKGKAIGGCQFTRGQIYYLLRNPIYAGDIAHKGKVYPGNHPAIIARDQWEEVREQLSSNAQGERTAREANTSPLAGLLFDPDGEPLIPVHTSKSISGASAATKKRYRYYVRKCDQHGTADRAAPALRIPAREIEQVVARELTSLLAEPFDLFERCGIPIEPQMLATIMQCCAALGASATKTDTNIILPLIERIIVHADRLELVLSVPGLAKYLGVQAAPSSPATVCRNAMVRLARTGLAVRLVHDNGPATARGPDPTILRLLLKAHGWWTELEDGNTNVTAIAQRENVSVSWITWVTRLAFLAPTVVEAILVGKARSGIDAKTLLGTGAIPSNWTEQAIRFLPETG